MGSSARSKRVVTAAKRDLQTWWIDDLGRWNQIDGISRSEDPVLDSSLGGQMMYRFYGMVRLEEAAQRLVCSWDVKYACAGALEVAGSYLRQGGRPVKLRFYFGGWREECFSDAKVAYQRLEASRAYANAEPLPRPSAVQRPLSEARDARRPYGKLLRALEASGGILTPRLRRKLNDCGLLHRLVLLEEYAAGAGLVFSHIGEQAGLRRLYGARWAAEAMNRPVEQVPFSIGQVSRLSEAYAAALELGTPRFDHVRSPIAMGAGELEWVSYKRLLVPYVLPTGIRGLMLLSDFSTSVDIPFMGWLADRPAYPQQQAA